MVELVLPVATHSSMSSGTRAIRQDARRTSLLLSEHVAVSGRLRVQRRAPNAFAARRESDALLSEERARTNLNGKGNWVGQIFISRWGVQTLR